MADRVVAPLRELRAKLHDGLRQLHVAAEGAHATVVRALLEAGANAGAVTSNTGVTPLHLAAKAIDGEGAVRELLARGAPVNAVENSAGQTPLMFAASYGRVAAIGELLKGGADPSIRTEVVDVLRRVAIDRAAKERLKQALIEEVDGCTALGPKELLAQRRAKFLAVG